MYCYSCCRSLHSLTEKVIWHLAQ